MNKWRVGEDIGSKEMDGCPLTKTLYQVLVKKINRDSSLHNRYPLQSLQFLVLPPLTLFLHHLFPSSSVISVLLPSLCHLRHRHLCLHLRHFCLHYHPSLLLPLETINPAWNLLKLHWNTSGFIPTHNLTGLFIWFVITTMSLVKCMGNPWVFSAIPIPAKTCTCATGTGFCMSQFFCTHTCGG
jgi:hypothetical protein